MAANSKRAPARSWGQGVELEVLLRHRVEARLSHHGPVGLLDVFPPVPVEHLPEVEDLVLGVLVPEPRGLRRRRRGRGCGAHPSLRF